MRLLIDNFIESATLTVNVPNAAFPEENIYSYTPVEVCEFDDYIVIDLGSTSQAVDAIGWLNTSDAITVEANTSDSWGAPAYSSGALTDNVEFPSSAQTYRYWRLYTGATDSRVGYFYLGEYLQLPPTDGLHTSKPENTDIVSETSGGQIYTTDNVVKKMEDVEFPVVTTAERTEIETWYYTSDRVKNHILVPFEDSFTVYPPYFARLNKYEPSRDKRSSAYSLSFKEAK